MPNETDQGRGQGIRLLAALSLAVGANTIANYLTAEINFSNAQYAGWLRFSIIVFLIVTAFWFGILRNPSVLIFFGALTDLQHSTKTVRVLSSQYNGLTLPITINAQERFPQWELPSVMCALADGVQKSIRAIYLLTPETFQYERSHTAQEGEYFEACKRSAYRIDGERTRDVIRRIFLVSEQVLVDVDLCNRAVKLINKHSDGLFGVRILCPAPIRPSSDFAIYDDNIVLKLEVEMFERRVSGGLVMWSRNAINNYAQTWDSLWRSPEARSPSEFYDWCKANGRIDSR